MNIPLRTINALIIFTLCVPAFARAAEIRFDSHRAEVKVGEQFVVDIIVHSLTPLNAIEGQIIFSDNLLQVINVHNGNSVVNFWLEKPQQVLPNTIAFSGITPGGWSSPNGHIFQIVFEATKDGIASIIFQGARVLQNNGDGTEEPLSVRNTEVVIKPGDNNIRKVSFADGEPPEDFVPIVLQDESMSEGKYVVVFSTQDKGSGVDGYEVKEFRFSTLAFFSRWIQAESPYVLKDQKLKSYIIVRANDNEGNKRVAMITPQYPLSLHEYALMIGILVGVLMIGILILKKTWVRK